MSMSFLQRANKRPDADGAAEPGKVSRLLLRVMYIAAAALCASVPFMWLLPDSQSLFAPGYYGKSLTAALVFLALAAAAVFAAAMFMRRGRGDIRTRDGVLVLAVTAVCFVVKLAAVLRWHVEPRADYATFFTTASDLAATGKVSLHRYVALFPHIFGTAAFYSVFFRVFGASTMTAAVLNVCLSAVTAALLYLLVRRYACKLSALAAAMLWTVCPSQTLYNIYVLSEPLYTALLVGALLLCDELRVRVRGGAFSKGRRLKTVVCAAGAGLLLGCVQLARPIGTIPLIALAGTLFILDTPYSLRGAAERAAAVVLTAAVLTGVTSAARPVMDAALGEPAARSVGYSYAVGLNEESGGRWSAEVSARLAEYDAKPGTTADDVQRAMMDDVRELIASGKVNYISLLGTKLRYFLLRDDFAVVSYGIGVFYRAELLSALCNGFYIVCALLAAVGAVFAAVKRERGPLVLAALFAIGLTAAQMLVEVAYRYHYSIYIALLPLAVYGLREIVRRFERKQNG